MDNNNENNQGTNAPAQPAVPAQPAAPQAQPDPTTNTGTPQGTSDRTTEQFEKLLESNRQLFRQNELLRQQKAEQGRQATQSNPSYPTPQNQPESVNPNDFVERDPLTGDRVINEQRLRARIEEIQQRAARAEQTIQSYMKSSEEREIERQNKDAFTAHPELDPGSDKFNAVFNKQVRGILTDSMFNPDDYSGRPLSFREAADFVKAQVPGTQQPANDAQAEAERQAQSQAAQALKEQVSTQATGQPRAAQQVTDDEELESLRYRTRYGNDDWALAKRIMHTEHILPQDADEV